MSGTVGIYYQLSQQGIAISQFHQIAALPAEGDNLNYGMRSEHFFLNVQVSYHLLMYKLAYKANLLVWSM